jgi:predicted nucleic acid-binding protein
VSAVVSDTSPLHYLVECEAIEILHKLFGEVLIPPTVHRELQHQKTPARVRTWVQSPPSWLKVQSPTTIDKSLNVDEGEREAICLAREVNAIAILMDDRKGRAEALRCGLRVAGTIVSWKPQGSADSLIFQRRSGGFARPMRALTKK